LTWEIGTRLEVVKILREIGTSKSVPTLTKLKDDPQILVKNTAAMALTTVQGRKQ
jgi:hypothetical protein